MEHNQENVVPLFRDIFEENTGGGGGGDMDNLIKRVEQLEKDTNQIRIDMATLTERSQNFATKSEMEKLIQRSDNFVTKSDLTQSLLDTEIRLNGKFDALNTKVDGISSKIFWALFFPTMTAILLWFVKVAVLKI